MFRDQSIFEIIQLGGFTMYLLVACSIISIAIIIERLVYFHRRSSLNRLELIQKIRTEYDHKQIFNAIDLCKKINTPSAKVALAGLHLHGHEEKIIGNAMEREITIETIKLERFTSIVASIGGTAVYIGLFGTVIGIMRAFSDISKVSSGGMDVVTKGIAEALVCTAAGLVVAIPAVIAFNYFSRRIDHFVVDMELVSSELLDILIIKRKQ